MSFLEENINSIILGDCLDFMKQISDKSIDLVLTDPPYGIDYGNQLIKGDEYKEITNKHGWRNFGNAQWDKKPPSKEVFNEIIRISKNQIIWGGNYFADLLPASQGWLVWNKGQRNFSLADGELAYTSFDKAMRIFDYARAKQLNDETREHPTQKPVKLFEWCLEYAKLAENAIILDCFSGSGTTAIACHNLNRNFICIEKDPDYHKASVERLAISQAQQKLF